jgi:hypothetical protein
MLRGEMGPATGWFGRGQRLLDREERECAERGYLLIPVLVGHAITGDHEAAYETATEIAEIGTHFAIGISSPSGYTSRVTPLSGRGASRGAYDCSMR